MKVLETAVEKVANSFLGHLHLWTWFDQEVTALLSGRQTSHFDSVCSFWDGVFNESLRPGGRITFRNCFLTEWIPRSPGLAWYMDRAGELPQWYGDEILSSVRKGAGFALESSADTSAQEPFGVVRLAFSESRTNYAALSLTTADSWSCDLGVPVIVSSAVYNAFIKARLHGNAVEGTIQGVLKAGPIPGLHPDLPKSLGSEINESFLRQVYHPGGYPSVYIELVSPLDVKFRTHGTHPPGSLWAITRQTHTAQVTHYAGSDSVPPRVTVRPCEPWTSYVLLTATAEIHEPDAIRAHVKNFGAGLSFTLSDVPHGGRGPRDHVGVDVLTEFDARSRYFKTAIPIERQPWSDGAIRAEISRTLGDLQRAQNEHKTPT